ncbi:MAG: sulfatase-like hydrolase/transferase [Victivallales bacterium]|nr:sulfatase-like hydrolase/transferase [Victivallales bacterium]
MTSDRFDMDRRRLIKTSGVVAAASTLPVTVSAQVARAGKKPNILIAICDQMVLDAISAYRRHFDHKAYLCHWVDTPNLDELVANGVSFTESHTPNPVCCPARASIFTGRYAMETGVIYNNVGIDRKLPNMGQWFEAHSGYDRVYCGKWHAGGPWNNPTISGGKKIPGFDTLPNGPDIWGRDMDYGVSSSVEAYVRNHVDDNPFLAVAGFMDPHDICFWGGRLASGQARKTDFFRLQGDLPVLPPNQKYQFDEIWRQPSGLSDMQWRNYIYDYCRMVERLDRNVGRLLRAVRDRGDDTVIIFTADHGDGVGRHSRISKWHPYEESVKVPLIVYGPKFGIRRNVLDTTHLVTGVDIMTTVCDYAGIKPPPKSRGLSLRPLLEGKPTEWRTSVFIELRRVGRVIRTAQYKYVMSYQPAPGPPAKAKSAAFVSRDTGKPAEFRQGEGDRLKRIDKVMLFDMKKDPWETVNLAGDPKFRDVIARHEAILRDEYEAHIVPGHEFIRK